MNEHSEDALAKAAELLGEHFAEFVIICAQKASRKPIIEHSGSVFSAKGLADAAAYQLDILGGDDNEPEDFTKGDPEVPA